MFFHLAQEGKILEGKAFLAFCSEFERHTVQDRLSRALDRAHFKYFLFKSAQNRCKLCPKSGLNLAQRWHFISVIQDAKVTVNHWDKPDDGVMCAGKENKASLKLVRMKTDVATHTCPVHS